MKMFEGINDDENTNIFFIHQMPHNQHKYKG